MEEAQPGGESPERPAARRRPIILRFTDEESAEIRQMAEDAECPTERVLQILRDACAATIRTGGLRAKLISERVRELAARAGVAPERLLGVGHQPTQVQPAAPPAPPQPPPALIPQLLGPHAAPPPGVALPPFPQPGPRPTFE